ncbi:hypothetical protein [Kibdelosporangium phytohabitans]|uniref:hypothetical protein n=1 Tax=Kibdelosporangium phytohabitans TaxID=860235 RepID=UPI0012FAD6DE|nr:hypothetical protein [Kibdelosporangium phytohabitans]
MRYEISSISIRRNPVSRSTLVMIVPAVPVLPMPGSRHGFVVEPALVDAGFVFGWGDVVQSEVQPSAVVPAPETTVEGKRHRLTNSPKGIPCFQRYRRGLTIPGWPSPRRGQSGLEATGLVGDRRG